MAGRHGWTNRKAEQQKGWRGRKGGDQAATADGGAAAAASAHNRSFSPLSFFPAFPAWGPKRTTTGAAATERLGEQPFIGSSIHDEHDADEGNQARKFLNFEHTTGVAPREAPEIHQHRVALVDQPQEHHFPRVVVAEVVVDAKPAIAIRTDVALAHPPIERLRPVGPFPNPASRPPSHENPSRAHVL